MGWTVLCVSKISPAQITRNMILERAGYQIVAVNDPDEAVRIFKTSAVSAVVFGDSINGELRFQLARVFKALNRAVPIVALSKTSGSQLPAGLIDQHLESLGDPHLLLEALQRVLSRDGDGSAHPAPDHDHHRASQDSHGSAKAASSHDGNDVSAKISGSKTPKNSAV
ncbi:MAG: response regulator [Acidobacteriia bacterium]|nr:response regulator [Terriglobia bacterium]